MLYLILALHAVSTWEPLSTWTQYKEHPLLQQARYMLDNQNSPIHFLFKTCVIAHGSSCCSFFLHAGKH